jgi:hypothetical protein
MPSQSTQSTALATLEEMLRDPVIMEGLPRAFAQFGEQVGIL